MKKPIHYLALAAILFLLAESTGAQTGKEALTGVWKYQLDTQEGIAIISPTHLIWLLTNKNRQPFSGATPSVSEKAEAYEAVIAAVATWEMESENRAKATYIYVSPVNGMGTSLRWDFERSGDELTYWVIQPDGSRGAPGKSRKMADWDAAAGVPEFNGVWRYEEPFNGMFIHSGSYGAWLMWNEPRPGAETPTEEEKAKIFETFSCTAGIGVPAGTGRQIWSILHASNIRDEKQSLFITSEKPAENQIAVWFIDPAGEQVGEKFRVRRVE